MILLIGLAVVLTAALVAVLARKALRWYRLRVHEARAAWAARKYYPQLRSLTHQLKRQASEAERLRQLLAKAEPQMRWAIEARRSFPSFAAVFDRIQLADAEQLQTLVDELNDTLDTIDVASLAGLTVTMADPRPPVLEGTGS